jgi:hypothetical protein
MGTTSAAQAVTLTNTGSATLNLAAITPSGDFSQTNNCGASVSAGGSCAINVTFAPTVAGARTGALTITNNAPNTPQTVALSGSGTAASSGPPVASLQPSALDFGSVVVGTFSPSQSVTLTNTGGGPLVISSIATNDGRFAQVNNCTAQVAAGGSCVISLTFMAWFPGSASASLVVTDNAASGLQSVALTAVAGSPTVALSVTTLNFGRQQVGTTSLPQSVILTNTSPMPTTITGITTTGDFGQTNNCGSILAAGGSCTINVTFSPSSYYFKKGSLAITDNATGSPQTVNLWGLGTIND